MAQLTHTIYLRLHRDSGAAQELFKEKGEAMGMNKITLNDIVMYAVARTLTDARAHAP